MGTETHAANATNSSSKTLISSWIEKSKTCSSLTTLSCPSHLTLQMVSPSTHSWEMKKKTKICSTCTHFWKRPFIMTTLEKQVKSHSSSNISSRPSQACQSSSELNEICA